MTTTTTGAESPTTTLGHLAGIALAAVSSFAVHAVRGPFASRSANDDPPSETKRSTGSHMLPPEAKTMKKPWVISQLD